MNRNYLFNKACQGLRRFVQEAIIRNDRKYLITIVDFKSMRMSVWHVKDFPVLNLSANCDVITAPFGWFAAWCFGLCSKFLIVSNRLRMSFCSFGKRVSGYIYKSFSIELVGDVCNAR